MRFQTTGGQFVSAATRAEAVAIAAQFGFGEIAGVAPAPAKVMSLDAAYRLRAEADEWPRCGQDWPADRRERQAAEVIAAAKAEESRS